MEESKPAAYMVVNDKELFRTLDGKKLERFNLDQYEPCDDWSLLDSTKNRVDAYAEEDLALGHFLSGNLKRPISEYCFYVAYGEHLSKEVFFSALKALGFDEMPVLGVHLRLPLAAYFGEGHALLDAKKEGSTICRAYLVSKEQLNALSLHLGDYGRHAIKLTGLGQGMDGYALTSAKQIPAKQPSFEYINHMLKGLEEMGNDFVDALAYISLIAGIADEIIAKHQA